MDIDTDLITAKEFEWVVNNEPTFDIDGNTFIGKVGKTPRGEDIRIKIELPDEFYPVVKPHVYVINEISHPNINSDGSLDLQLLDEWEPRYRLKDIISAIRRLFVKSRNSISEKTTPQPSVSKETLQRKDQTDQLEKQVQELQQEINDVNSKINHLKAEKLENGGINPLRAVPISPDQDAKATKKAIEDFLHLIEIKFEEADMDEIAFFRLYKKYIGEHYQISKKIETKGGLTHDISEKKTERPIGS